MSAASHTDANAPAINPLQTFPRMPGFGLAGPTVFIKTIIVYLRIPVRPWEGPPWLRISSAPKFELAGNSIRLTCPNRSHHPKSCRVGASSSLLFGKTPTARKG
ncbi:hypothetical protein LY76DRAFT_587454 [Colletotrichum caudatum]|nr:hypothetical protein LY76DRAFT_587454 [Colletotrichum caudatum]